MILYKDINLSYRYIAFIVIEETIRQKDTIISQKRKSSTIGYFRKAEADYNRQYLVTPKISTDKIIEKKLLKYHLYIICNRYYKLIEKFDYGTKTDTAAINRNTPR